MQCPIAIGSDGGLMDDAGFAKSQHGGQSLARLLREMQGVLLAVPLNIGHPRLAVGIDTHRREVGLSAVLAQHLGFGQQFLRKAGSNEKERENGGSEHGALNILFADSFHAAKKPPRPFSHENSRLFCFSCLCWFHALGR